MGFEIAAHSPQVTEKTHPHPSIWAHLGAEFCVGTKHLAHFVHCFSSCVTDYVSISLKRRARVRVSHLLLSDLWIGAYVDQ